MSDDDNVIKVYGTRGNSACFAIRDFLYRADVPFQWIEITNDEQARKLGLTGVDDERLPICVFPDGTRLEHPTIRQITEKLGWFKNPSRSEYDLAIYGAGPAGLSAAVYGASEGSRPSWSSGRWWEDRPAPAPGSRTISAFPRGSAAPSWPTAPASRRSSSAPRS